MYDSLGMHNIITFFVLSQESSAMIWKLPVRSPLVLWTKPKTHSTWGRSRFLRRQVWLLLLAKQLNTCYNILIVYSNDCMIIYTWGINMFTCLYFFHEEDTRGEEREKRESLPPVKRPLSGCGEMENSISTKRPRIHQQNENQQVRS